MILEKQCDRLAAFYAAYERVKFGDGKQLGERRYSTRQADDWGHRVGLQPVPDQKATAEEIEAWERKLADALKRGGA